MPLNAVLVVDKPAGWTSHDVVARMRKLLDERSAGHLGTLDPMATGVLPIVLGKLTRLSQFYNDSEKSYEGEIRLGFATDTYDAEGEPTGPAAQAQVSLEQVREIAAQFVGCCKQVPPPFSAKKLGGVPAYRLARRKQAVNLEAVEVEIREFDILGFGETEDRVRFCARVSSGTYIRSIAHDMGQRLGCGAHLAALRRTSVSEFSISQAHTIAEIESAAVDGKAAEYFVHPRCVLPSLPSVTATGEAVGFLRHGRSVNLPEFSKSKLVKVFAGQAEIVCIAQRIAGTLFHPKVVFSAEGK